VLGETEQMTPEINFFVVEVELFSNIVTVKIDGFA
jgi:hypothetical protein